MQFSDSIFATRFGITRHDLEGYLGEALSQGGDYADLYFEYLLTSSTRSPNAVSVGAISTG